MTTLTAKGNWNIVRGKLKQKIARLTADPLEFAEGKEAELLGRIQKRSGQSEKNSAPGANECQAGKCKIEAAK
jgi:uncharacterized protein YjbJ (UPF0337 family)